MKEYLNTETYEYKRANEMPEQGKWVEIPKGAQSLSTDGDGDGLIFWKDDFNLVVGLDDCWDRVHQNFIYFHSKYPRCKVLWIRQTKPEALPFIDDEPQSLNEQYAEIEQVRQAVKVKSGGDSDHAADAMSYGFMGIKQDNVNHPSHYTQGKVECIDAIEAGMSEEMFEGYLKGCCNKYLWRYKMKGGSESLRKAQWYLDRLIKLNEKIESRN